MVQPPIVASLVQRNKSIAKRKGTVAAAATGGAVALTVVLSSPVLPVIAFAGAAYLGWDWLSFRIRNGLRF